MDGCNLVHMYEMLGLDLPGLQPFKQGIFFPHGPQGTQPNSPLFLSAISSITHHGEGSYMRPGEPAIWCSEGLMPH